MEQHETYIYYMMSWTPKSGEAYYSRGFDTREERDAFVKSMAPIAKTIHSWEKECWK